jgi:hypothetical protein
MAKPVARHLIEAGRPGNDLPIMYGNIRAALDAVLGSQPIAEETRCPDRGFSIKCGRGMNRRVAERPNAGFDAACRRLGNHLVRIGS